MIFYLLRKKIVNFITPEPIVWESDEEKVANSIETQVNQRVAEALMKMDPFEPFLKKFHGIFSEEFVQPEDNLSPQNRIRLFSWAYGAKDDPSFKHLTNFIQNVQANNTLRKATNEYEWFYGRSAIVTIELFVAQVGRLGRLYEEVVMRKTETFDLDLTVE